MSPKSISIKDIARAVGMSHSTVSRALSDSPLVAKDTKRRIQRVAHEMGYVPSAIARGLVTKRTRTIGLVVTTITDPFIGEVVQGVEERAMDADYSVILCDCNAEPERELANVRVLREKRVDAIIVTSSRVGNLYVPLLEDLDVPIVLINNQQAGEYVYSVRSDDHQGGRLVGEYLASLGHRRIAYITGPPNASRSLVRLEGCRSALREHGLDIDPQASVPGDGRTEGGEAAVARLLQLSPHPTAIFCYNDMTAIGALRALKKAGLDVPGDVSVIGYDDIPFSAYVAPPLTTVAQPKNRLGQRAMELTLRLLEGEEGNAEEQGEELSDIVLTPAFIERASSGPAPSS